MDANESRAEIAACRAAFHKKITTYQLQTVSDALQRLRSLYIELDTKLETYSSQVGCSFERIISYFYSWNLM